MAILPGVAVGLPAPSDVTAIAGPASPIVARLTWSSVQNAVAYDVYVSFYPDGEYDLVSRVEVSEYDFTDGAPGIDYYFRVAAVDASGTESSAVQEGPVTAVWKYSPHVTASTASRTCGYCHPVHAASSDLLAENCESCHDGSRADANVTDGKTDSFGLASGHTLGASKGADALTQRCSSCHAPHSDATSSRMIPTDAVNGVSGVGAGRSWCLACHESSADWYGPGYPSAASPSRDASGYPVAGTWPGKDVYLGALDAHARIPSTVQTPDGDQPIRRDSGDCLYCHAAHRGPNKYDGLVDTYRPTSESTVSSDQAQGTYAALCLTCHGGAVPSGFSTAPADVKRFVTGGSVSAGHRIKTAGGTLPVGSPLPCYDCHGPHGSVRGNRSLISDTLGASLETSDATGVRRFCFTCHTTADTGTGWNSSESTYAAPASDSTIEGLQRSSGALRLPESPAHDQAAATSCYECHGNDYSAGGGNVHAPGPGTALAGDHTAVNSGECVICHRTADVTAVHTAGCATCHGNPAYPNLLAGKTVECVSCHNGIDVGSHAYSPVDPNHYDEPTHTATPFTAAYQGGSTVASGGVECALCHSADLRGAHAHVTATGGALSCVECHTAASLDSTAVVSAGWTSKQCTECHAAGGATVHASYETTHVVSAGTCAGTGSSCHSPTDLASLHAASQSGAAPRYNSCADADPADPTACHKTLDTRPVPNDPAASCGSGTTGCHQDKTPTNHG